MDMWAYGITLLSFWVKRYPQLDVNKKRTFVTTETWPYFYDTHLKRNIIMQVGVAREYKQLFVSFMNDLLKVNPEERISIDDAVTLIINGPEEICNLLKSPGKLLEENCKVLVNFDADRT